MEPIAIRPPAGSRPRSATARRTPGGGRARRLAAALAILLSSAAVARAETAELCEQEMARAARENGIPLNILYSVGLTETGHAGALSPWDMNVDGRAVHSASLDEALQRFAAERARGAKLIDVGCMQINHHWHASHFASLAEMFDPVRNVDYAAGYLKDAQGPGGQLDAGGGALQRRPRQSAGAEDLRLQRHRQHGGERHGRMDAERPRVLPSDERAAAAARD